jgi:uncharacterized membrane protein
MRRNLESSSRGQRLLLAASAAALAFASLGGCAFLGGAAVGAAGTGTAYEVQNRKALDDLDEEFSEGRIGRDEYLRRKREIEKRSAVY